MCTATLAVSGTGSLLAACQQPTSPVRSPDSRPAEANLPDLKLVQPPPASEPSAALGDGLGQAGPDAEGGPGAARPPTASVPGNQSAPAIGPPKPGGSTVWAAEADPGTLDPHRAPSRTSVQAWGDLTYQSLVTYDQNLELVPCLAEAWVNTSPTTWTFKLRQGVRFHDGSELEAEDVRFWYDRTMAPETAAPYASWFSQITKVEPRGKYEVEFTLAEPYGPFLATFAAMRGSAIVPRRWMQTAGAAATTSAVGTGPFKIAEYVPQRHIRYVKNQDYWEQGLPYLDEVTLTIVPDEASRVAALQSGEVTYARVGPEVAVQLADDTSLTVQSSAGPSQQVTILNAKRAPFDDVRVRQAIALTVDRTAALRQVIGGQGRLTGPMPTGHGDWAPPPESLPYHQDGEMAKQLLAEAGHPDGFEATIRTTSDQPALLATSMALASQLQAIGITLHVEQLEWGVLAAAIAGGDFDLYATEIDFLPDPDHYFSLYGPNASKTLFPGVPSFAAWEHTRYAEIVGQARTQMDPGARKHLYDEATAILLNEAPAIWWFTENRIDALHTSVKGYRHSFSERRLGLKQTWLNA